MHTGAKDWVVELNSFSKSHNMAGWRVGMLCGASNRIEEILRFKSNMDSGMFLPVQLAAAHALTLGKEWHDSVNNTYRSRREKVFLLLDGLGCSYRQDQAGLFAWAGVPKGFKDGYELSDEILYKARVFITPGGIFGDAGKNYIRVSLCCPEERIVEAINRIGQVKSNEAAWNRKRIAIVRVGLIGGSLAIQLHEKKLSSKLVGVETQ